MSKEFSDIPKMRKSGVGVTSNASETPLRMEASMSSSLEINVNFVWRVGEHIWIIETPLSDTTDDSQYHKISAWNDLRKYHEVRVYPCAFEEMKLVLPETSFPISKVWQIGAFYSITQRQNY